MITEKAVGFVQLAFTLTGLKLPSSFIVVVKYLFFCFIDRHGKS